MFFSFGDIFAYTYIGHLDAIQDNYRKLKNIHGAFFTLLINNPTVQSHLRQTQKVQANLETSCSQLFEAMALHSSLKRLTAELFHGVHLQTSQQHFGVKTSRVASSGSFKSTRQRLGPGDPNRIFCIALLRNLR